MRTSAINTCRIKLFTLVVVSGVAIYLFAIRTLAANDFDKNTLSGARIYSESCSSCHGPDGSANTRRGKRKGATDLRKSRISVAKGIRIITNGRGNMPKFKEVLTKEEIVAVNTYVRGFRGN